MSIGKPWLIMAGPSVKLLQGSLGRRLRQSFDFSYFQRGYQQQLDLAKHTSGFGICSILATLCQTIRQKPWQIGQV